MFHADLHIHSKFSRACSKDCDIEHLSWWALRKGLRVLGTGDFTHPAWAAELRETLVPAEPGLFRIRPDLERRLCPRHPGQLRGDGQVHALGGQLVDECQPTNALARDEGPEAYEEVAPLGTASALLRPSAWRSAALLLWRHGLQHVPDQLQHRPALALRRCQQPRPTVHVVSPFRDSLMRVILQGLDRLGLDWIVGLVRLG